MKAIHNIKQPITDLTCMIGMQKLKNNVINQILYFIQFHINHENKKNNSDFMLLLYMDHQEQEKQK